MTFYCTRCRLLVERGEPWYCHGGSEALTLNMQGSTWAREAVRETRS